MDKQDMLLSQLAHFTGTENYIRYSPFFPTMLTDGTAYLAETAGAFWLFDAIASYSTKLNAGEFYVAHLQCGGGGAVLTICTDMDEGKHIGVVARQEIEYTDFPLDEIKLYLQHNGRGWVIMLPSEY